MAGWLVAAALAVAVVALLVDKAEPSKVYLCFGYSWRRPRRVGRNVGDDFDRHHFRACTNSSCWSRLCKYAHGVDTGSRSWLWSHEIDWQARPKLWLWPFSVRRRHRVFYVPCPSVAASKWVEDRLLAYYQPPFNVHWVRRENRHRRTAA